MSPEGFVDLGIDGVEDAVPIGSGGAAIVYRARQPRLNRTVAVKVIQAIGDEASARRFAREARALGQLSEHPGIVTVHDIGTTAMGQPYLLMQFCSAGSLQDRVNAAGTLSAAEAISIARPIAQALAHAHDQGIMHRDLKPANILIDARGRYQVADFGIAALADTSAIVSTAVSFTPGYAPPETIQGEPATPAGDVYSLGATMYALVTGAHPFAEDGESNIYTLINRILNDELEDTRLHGVPDELAEVISACTAKDPAARPSMPALVQWLEQLEGAPHASPPAPPPSAEPPTVITGPTPPVGPGGDPAPVQEGPASRRAWWMVGAAALLLAVVAAVVVVATRGGDDPVAEPATSTTQTERSTTSGSSPPSSEAPVQLGEVAVVATLDVGSELHELAVIDGAVWVPDRPSGVVSVIDPAEASVVGEITAGASPLQPVGAAGRVWIPNDGDGTVTVVDPATMEVTGTVDVGERPRTPVLINGRLWVPNIDSVSVIDTATLGVDETLPMEGRPRRPLAAGNLIWVPVLDAGVVAVIDPPTEKVIQSLAVGERPLLPRAIAGRVWVTNEADGTVSVIDPATRRVVETVNVGERPREPVWAGGLVWVSNFDSGTVSVIDPDTLAVIDTVTVDGGVGPGVEHEGHLWLPVHDTQSVVIVDLQTREIVDRGPVGANPAEPVVAGDRVFVPNRADGTVTVLEAG